MLLALVMAAMTASADQIVAQTYKLKVGTNEHGTVTIKSGDNTLTAVEGVYQIAENIEVTVIITPDNGYIVNTEKVEGVWNAAVAASRGMRRSEEPGNIALLDSIALTHVSEDATTKAHTYTFTMQRADAELSVKYKAILQDSWIQDITAPTYTGEALEPAVTVKQGETTLVKDVDYELTYTNNINARNADEENAPTVTVTAIGENYTGEASKTFTIQRLNGTVSFDVEYVEKNYFSSSFTQQANVTGDGTVSYSSSNTMVADVDENTGQVIIWGTGTAVITARVTDAEGGNYTYPNTASYTVIVSTMSMPVTAQGYTGEYDGQPHTISVSTTVTGAAIAYGTTAGTCNLQEPPTFTEVGEYTVYYKVSKKNYTTVLGSKKVIILTPLLTLDEEDVNTVALDAADGKWYDATLRRSLLAGMWNTLAVPFDVDAATLTAMGITAKELTGSSFVDGTLTLDFGDATSLEAGKPYLVKVSEEVTDPAFSMVKVSKTAVPAETDAVDFVPTLGKTEITGDAKKVLFLTSGNKLQFPEALPADFKGFRAYFLLKGEAAAARSFLLNLGEGETGETTSLKNNEQRIKNNEAGAWYDLQGRRVNGAARKGVYVVNGKKVVIK